MPMMWEAVLPHCLLVILDNCEDFVVTHFHLTRTLRSIYTTAAVAVGPKMQASEAIPFLEKPAKLTDDMPGNVGFDPLGFSDNYDLNWLRVSDSNDGRTSFYLLSHLCCVILLASELF